MRRAPIAGAAEYTFRAATGASDTAITERSSSAAMEAGDAAAAGLLSEMERLLQKAMIERAQLAVDVRERDAALAARARDCAAMEQTISLLNANVAILNKTIDALARSSATAHEPAPATKATFNEAQCRALSDARLPGADASPQAVVAALLERLGPVGRESFAPAQWNGLARAFGLAEQTHSGLERTHARVEQARLEQAHSGLERTHAGLERTHAGLERTHADLDQTHIGLEQRHASLEQSLADMPLPATPRETPMRPTRVRPDVPPPPQPNLLSTPLRERSRTRRAPQPPHGQQALQAGHAEPDLRRGQRRDAAQHAIRAVSFASGTPRHEVTERLEQRPGTGNVRADPSASAAVFSLASLTRQQLIDAGVRP